MGTLRFKYTPKPGGAPDDHLISKSDFEKFNVSLLDLGDVSTEGEYFEALAAIFDLEAFTSFCNQIDPHLVVPEYLSEFLSWLFERLRVEFFKKKEGENVILWGHLPFFAKFLGDGVLFLWDTRNLDPESLGNIVISLRSICLEYSEKFLPDIKKIVSKPPVKLRCGIARGQIISIGDGKDFVGPCINVAARLQKIGQFSFAFSKRGFNLKKSFAESYQAEFMLIKAPIRGVGDEELIFVNKVEFQGLPAKEKKVLRIK
jgi:hypothetical protein